MPHAYQQNMGSGDTNNLNFMGTGHQASEGVARSSYGNQGGLLGNMGGGINHLN